MSSLSHPKYQRQRIVKYAQRHSVTETAIRYKVSRKTVYKWLSRYDGTTASLEDRSHRPKTSPKSHTELELRQIRRRLKKYKWTDLILAYQELVEIDGYTRSYGGFKRVAARLKALKPMRKKKKKRKSKPYQRADYPGQKIQIDVKYVPSYCVADGRKYYQYTAVDECSRWTYREMYDEHSTHSSVQFLIGLINHCPFPIREIQTDNGAEFTRALISKDGKPSLFEKALEMWQIKYHRIRIATPRHNGKVERQHRCDELRFYKKMRMYSLEDGRKQLEKYNKLSNNIPKICLGFLSPNEALDKYLGVM